MKRNLKKKKYHHVSLKVETEVKHYIHQVVTVYGGGVRLA